jgi:hypothetical protein
LAEKDIGRPGEILPGAALPEGPGAIAPLEPVLPLADTAGLPEADEKSLGNMSQKGVEPPMGPPKTVGPSLEKQAEEQPKEEAEPRPQERKQEGAQGAYNRARQIAQEKRGVKSFNIAEAERIVNTELDLVLNTAAVSAWVSVIGIPIGAFVGDVLWLFGPKIFLSASKITGWVVKKIPTPSGLKEKLDVDSIKLELSWRVKLHIIGMNIVTAAVIIGILVIIASVFWGFCNGRIPSLAKEAIGIEPYCKYFQTKQ